MLLAMFHFSTIADSYDSFLFDLWGVVHDGAALYPDIRECLEHLRARDKKIIFISNAPRRSAKVIAVLSQLGIEPALYDSAIASGEVGFRALKNGALHLGERYFYIGPEKDYDVMDGLNYASVSIEEADFVLNVGFGTEAQSSHDCHESLVRAKTRELPMLCLNPDFEVVRITGERFPCAGVIARDYEVMGGTVHYFGKPYPAIYETCITELGNPPLSRILAVGDSIHTDIAGAHAMQIDSVLITGGILRNAPDAEIRAQLARDGFKPVAIAPYVAW